MQFSKLTANILRLAILAPCLLLSKDQGITIAFAGLSGSGKTTMAKELVRLYPYHSLIEPEEEEWPDVIRKREIFGNFSMWMGFRELWLPLQFEAQSLKKTNQTVFLDSYFIKIIGYELDEEGMEWLFPKDDPYYQTFRQVCQLDIEHLPDPDCIVLFDVSYDTWLKLLASRDRNWDRTPGFLQSYEQTKNAITKAVERLCLERNIMLVHFEPEFGDVTKQAMRLHEMLIHEKIL